MIRPCTKTTGGSGPLRPSPNLMALIWMSLAGTRAMGGPWSRVGGEGDRVVRQRVAGRLRPCSAPVRQQRQASPDEGQRGHGRVGRLGQLGVVEPGTERHVPEG